MDKLKSGIMNVACTTAYWCMNHPKTLAALWLLVIHGVLVVLTCLGNPFAATTLILEAGCVLITSVLIAVHVLTS